MHAYKGDAGSDSGYGFTARLQTRASIKLRGDLGAHIFSNPSLQCVTPAECPPQNVPRYAVDLRVGVAGRLAPLIEIGAGLGGLMREFHRLSESNASVFASVAIMANERGTLALELSGLRTLGPDPASLGTIGIAFLVKQ